MEKKIQTTASLITHSFSAHLDDVLLSNGKVGKRIRIDHPEAAAVVPFVSRDEILMVRQYRYALGRETLEIPAGKLDSGETPEEAAKRELQEETGYQVGQLDHIYTYAPAIGYANELIHIFSGHKLKKTNPSVDDIEISSLEVLHLDEVRDRIRKGLILDGKTIIGVCLAEFLSKSTGR
jgi:ADP-ribose pyrophosphatase